MRKVNEEILFAEFDKLIADKEAVLANQDAEIQAEKAKIDSMEYSDHVKEILFGEVSAEIEKKFADKMADLEGKIAFMEQFIIVEEDEVIEEETAENAEIAENEVVEGEVVAQDEVAPLNI